MNGNHTYAAARDLDARVRNSKGKLGLIEILEEVRQKGIDRLSAAQLLNAVDPERYLAEARACAGVGGEV